MSRRLRPYKLCPNEIFLKGNFSLTCTFFEYRSESKTLFTRGLRLKGALENGNKSAFVWIWPDLGGLKHTWHACASPYIYYFFFIIILGKNIYTKYTPKCTCSCDMRVCPPRPFKIWTLLPKSSASNSDPQKKHIKTFNFLVENSNNWRLWLKEILS